MRGGILTSFFVLSMSGVFATNVILPSQLEAISREEEQKKSVKTLQTIRQPNKEKYKNNDDSAEIKEKNYFETMGSKLEKGKIGASLLFSGKNTTNTDVDLVFAGIDKLVQKSFRINTAVTYFLKNNFGIGASLGYTTSEYQLQANILQNFLNRNIESNDKTYTFNPFIKNYISLSNKNIIYITNQTELQYHFQTGAYLTLINKNAGASIPIPGAPTPEQTLQIKNNTTHYLGLGIRPGILIFFNPHIAFETNIGLLSWGYKVEKLTYKYPEGEPDIKQKQNNTINKSTGLDFKFNVLNIGFGLFYYL